MSRAVVGRVTGVRTCLGPGGDYTIESEKLLLACWCVTCVNPRKIKGLGRQSKRHRGQLLKGSDPYIYSYSMILYMSVFVSVGSAAFFAVFCMYLYGDSVVGKVFVTHSSFCVCLSGLLWAAPCSLLQRQAVFVARHSDGGLALYYRSASAICFVRCSVDL